MPRADRHAQPGTGALWLLGWPLVAIMRIVAFIFFMLKTMVLLFKTKTIFTKILHKSIFSEYLLDILERNEY